MRAAVKDFRVEKGTDWIFTIAIAYGTTRHYTRQDIDSLTPRMVLDVANVGETILTIDDGITRDSINKRFKVSVTQLQTATFTDGSTYKFEVTDSLGKKSRILKGKIIPED